MVLVTLHPYGSDGPWSPRQRLLQTKGLVTNFITRILGVRGGGATRCCREELAEPLVSNPKPGRHLGAKKENTAII